MACYRKKGNTPLNFLLINRNITYVVNIAAIAADKAQQGDVFLSCQSHGRGSNGSPGNHDPEACLDDLFQIILRDAAAGEDDGLAHGDAVFQGITDDLVQCIVAADVFPIALNLTVGDQCTAVGAAGGLEQVAGGLKKFLSQPQYRFYFHGGENAFRLGWVFLAHQAQH